MAKQLIIIPGLGDRSRAYEVFRFVWKLRGYDMHIFVFGWNDDSGDFDAKLQALLDHIDGLGQRVDIIGVSAGGTAAVHALLQRQKAVDRVVTVASPLTNTTPFDNRLLMRSMRTLEPRLQGQPKELKARMLSVHGLYDQRVSTDKSQPAGIRHKRMWLVWHGPIIFFALTVFTRTIRKFLEKG